MHPAVVEVTPHDDHLLSVVFENGQRGWLDINIKPFLEFGVFQKIKDDHAFRQVRVSFVSTPSNGAAAWGDKNQPF